MAKDKNLKEFLINNELNINPNDDVRLIGDETQIVKFKDAIVISKSEEKDLIGINLNVQPPILRLDDYHKFLYNLKKANKKNKEKPLKEIDLNVNIAPNDLQTKVNQAKRFIENGSKVKVVLTIRGRETTHMDLSKKTLFDFISLLSDVAVAENEPKMIGNKFIVIFKKK
jgi:translation initiation factor IF-3